MPEMNGQYYRSESNATGNAISRFAEYNMTSYPGVYDTRTSNKNMEGYISMGDDGMPADFTPNINYAEHVNALADAVMVIQQVLGLTPYIDSKGVEHDNVSDRLTSLESMDGYYDERYGGVTTDGIWKPEWGQTILTHTHGGGSRQAPKIRLSQEVEGLLPKANINTNKETGLTGADLFVSSVSNELISNSLIDKLSTSNGGTVKGDTSFEGALQSRINRDYSIYDNSLQGTLEVDTLTTYGQCKAVTGTPAQKLFYTKVENLLAGKYVLGVRLRTNTLTAVNVGTFNFRIGNTTTGTLTIKGSDFSQRGIWEMFYFVFDYIPDGTNNTRVLEFLKPETENAAIKIGIDCAFITPAHPGVFDK